MISNPFELIDPQLHLCLDGAAGPMEGRLAGTREEERILSQTFATLPEVIIRTVE